MLEVAKQTTLGKLEDWKLSSATDSVKSAAGAASEASVALSHCSLLPPQGGEKRGGVGGVGLCHGRHGGWVREVGRKAYGKLTGRLRETQPGVNSVRLSCCFLLRSVLRLQWSVAWTRDRAALRGTDRELRQTVDWNLKY